MAVAEVAEADFRKGQDNADDDADDEIFGVVGMSDDEHALLLMN